MRGVELLQSSPEIISHRRRKGSQEPRFNLDPQHPELPVTPVSPVRSPLELKQRVDFVTKGWVAWSARSKQMWEKWAKIVEEARVNTDYIGRLTPAMRMAVNMLFLPGGSYIPIKDLKGLLSQLEISESSLRRNVERATNKLEAWMSGKSESPHNREKPTKSAIEVASNEESQAKLQQNTPDAQKVRNTKEDVPEWKKREELVALARDKGYLKGKKGLSPNQQKVINVIFSKSGGHNSVETAARKLHRNSSSVYRILKAAIRQLNSKTTTGEFLKRGKKRDDESIKALRDKKKKLEEVKLEWERRRALVQYAVRSKIFEKLAPQQQNVLRERWLSSGKNWPLSFATIANMLGVTRSAVQEAERLGLEKIVEKRAQKVVNIGGSSDPRERDSLLRYLTESGIIEIEKEKSRKTKSKAVSIEVVKQIENLASQRQSVSQIVAALNKTFADGKYSWYLVSAIALRYKIPIEKGKKGPHAKGHQSSFV